MSRALAWLAPVALLPLAALGLWLWGKGGALVWLSGFVATCL